MACSSGIAQTHPCATTRHQRGELVGELSGCGAGIPIAEFPATTAEQSLQLHNRHDLRLQVCERALDHLIRHGFDRGIVLGQCLASFQAGNRRVRLVHRNRNQLVFHSPLEGTLDAAHVLVDVPAADAQNDHPFANRFEGQGPELVNWRISVQFLEGLHRGLDARLLARGLAVLDVERLGELPVGGNLLLDGDRLRRLGGKLAAVLSPLPHEAVGFAVTGLGTLGAEVMVLAVDRDDSLPAGAVFTVLGIHCTSLPSLPSVHSSNLPIHASKSGTQHSNFQPSYTVLMRFQRSWRHVSVSWGHVAHAVAPPIAYVDRRSTTARGCVRSLFSGKTLGTAEPANVHEQAIGEPC